MKVLQGTNVAARFVASRAPRGYIFVMPQYGRFPGYILPGPDLDTITTVHLVDGDDGQWFRKLVEERGGVVTEPAPL